MKQSCDVILDLIPLVKDGVASEDSVLLVNEHIEGCESCKEEFETFEGYTREQLQIKDEKIIFNMKRSIFITQLIILSVGAIVGVALSNSMGMFYNFLIMPLIGGISLTSLKKKWYFSAVAVFLLTYIWQTINMFFLDGFRWESLYIGVYYSIIYTGLVILGVVIAILLKFALRKER